MVVKLFTMVKDENDIIDDWIRYHGNLFGINNIYIIDNQSTDGTYQLIEKYNGVHLYSRPDYKQKGVYMKDLIDSAASPDDFCIPIDIDEFIVYYDGSISTDKNTIINHIYGLPISPIYKMDYISPLITQPGGYDHACREITRGSYNHSMGNLAKSFFRRMYYSGNIDHGNHLPCNNYILTKLCLVHYHERNLEQMIKKNNNNVCGLGYPNDRKSLRAVLNNNSNCDGNHHIKTRLRILRNKFSITSWGHTAGDIDLTPLRDSIRTAGIPIPTAKIPTQTIKVRPSLMCVPFRK